MSTQFSIYYNSLEHKEYLRQIIEASDTGSLVESHDLAHGANVTGAQNSTPGKYAGSTTIKAPSRSVIQKASPTGASCFA